jgi:DNA-entry nuclease
MEAYSVEDNGRGICFCVYAYNVQPGVSIDYFTGVNAKNGESLPEINDENDDRLNGGAADGEVCDYILNTNTKKFHKPKCTHAKNLTGTNRKETDKTRDEVIALGYSPCGTCKP